MNILVAEKIACQLVDGAALTAHFIAAGNYKQMYREEAERHTKTIEVAIKSLIALY